jgi:hypothetical protein
LCQCTLGTKHSAQNTRSERGFSRQYRHLQPQEQFPDDPRDEGKKAIANAREHLGRATPVERALIEAPSVRYDTDQFLDRSTRDDKFIAATRSVADRFPDDMETQFLYADAITTRGAWPKSVNTTALGRTNPR